ncbi:uncharacterized protein DDB_G0292642-like isoform X2 [Scylla paramamosain]|uniref:uncharacterized protein DDB_G0292642-like isoform X2 n=1 Tax=Scylla paramamosain TaxID=85552 RepID=UPI0030833FA6
MATLIRIKRRAAEEPLETILVRAKRRKVDEGVEGAVGGADSGLRDQPAAILARVATVETKEARVDARVLQEAQKGWQLRQRYKRLDPKEGRKEAGRREAKERERERRYQITSSFRGNITTTTTTTTTTASTTTTTTAQDSKDRKRKTEEEEEEHEEGEEEEKKIKIFDSEISSLRNTQEDVITCNGEPMEVKFVYDLYYLPSTVDWGDLVCEDAYDYITRPNRRNLLRCDSDRSFDVEEYEEEEEEPAFDDFGNLVIGSLRHRLALTRLTSESESD